MMERSLAVLWVLIAFTLPFSFIGSSNSIAIIILVFGTVLINLKNNTADWGNTKFIWPLLIYFLILLFTLFYSENISFGLKKIETTLSFLVFSFLAVYGHKSCEPKMVIRGFVWANVLAILICIVNALFSFGKNPALIKGSFYFTEILDIHPTYLGMFLTFSIGLIWNFTSCFSYKSYKWPAAILSVFLIITVIYLKSRSAILALALITTFAFFKKVFYNTKSKNIRFAIVGFLSSIGVLLIYLINRFGLSEFNKLSVIWIQRDSLQSINVRLETWKGAINAIMDAPIFGYGVGDAQIVLHRYFYIQGFDLGIDHNFNAHNQFLESGIIGGIFFVSALMSFFVVLFRRFRKKMNLGIISFIITIVCAMSFESILNRQHGIVFFCLFFVVLNLGCNEDN